MCVAPSFVHVGVGAGYEKVPVPCRKCWQCHEDYIRDYTGRCLAEASDCEAVATITLTYGPRDDFADRVVQPLHFQQFMKRLRRSGHKLKYLVASETGTQGTRRVHFHAVLMFRHLAERDPRKPLAAYGRPGPLCKEVGLSGENMLHISEWPHGHVFLEWSVSPRSVRYVCKYALKDAGRQWLSMSKKPPIGHAWFQRKALLARNLGVVPWSFRYVPPGVDDDKRGYLMTGVTRRNYLETLLESRDIRRSTNEWVAKSIEKLKLHQRRVAWSNRTIDEMMADDMRALEMRIEAGRMDWKENDQKRFERLLKASQARYGASTGDLTSGEDWF